MPVISLFMAANVELFAAVLSTIISICFVLLRNRGVKTDEVDDPSSPGSRFPKEPGDMTDPAVFGNHRCIEPPSLDKKLVSRKLCKKSSSKKKKTKGPPWLLRTLKDKEMDDQAKLQSNGAAPRCANGNKQNSSGKATKNATQNSRDSTRNNPKSVKMYAPLALYTSLQMTHIQLYISFLPYIVTNEEMRSFGFPIEIPGNPGKIIVKNTGEDPCVRWCCRCGTKYYITDDLEYQSDTICKFHPGKRATVAGIVGVGAYSCCFKDPMSEGCKLNIHHVSAQMPLHRLTFVRTRFKRVTNAVVNPKVFALDCEMCYTVLGLEVAKISIVGADGLAIIDTHVLPQNPVLDYNTKYSGVSANDLKGVTTTLADVQTFLLRVLDRDTILVGHALENDLKALRVIHETIVDTSIVFPHQHGPPFKRSLRDLASGVLKQTIQVGDSGHDSVEDARTCLELMLWKITANRKQCTPSFKQGARLYSPFPVIQSSHPPVQMTPLVIPYAMGFWVPPVGSHSELY